MRVLAAFLANAAEPSGGLLHALGAFPAFLEVQDLPFKGRTTLVVVSEFENVDQMATAPVVMATLRRTRDDSLLVEGPLDVSGSPSDLAVGDWPLITSVVVPVSAVIEDVGRHRIELARDGEVMATVNFGIRLAPSGPQGGSGE